MGGGGGGDGGGGGGGGRGARLMEEYRCNGFALQGLILPLMRFLPVSSIGHRYCILLRGVCPS